MPELDGRGYPEDDMMENRKIRLIPCPSCGKMTPYEHNPFRPFCSRGCKGIDFIRWTDESYRIEKNEHDDDPRPGGNGE
jgi:uncharacterized protein